MSREAQSMEGNLTADASAKVFKKLKLLHEAATKTENQCRELQTVLEKAQRASTKYVEAKIQLLPWLEEVEHKLDEFDQMDEQLVRRDTDESLVDELGHLTEEIAERRLLVDKIVNAGEKLGQMGGIEIKTESSQLNERYQDCRDRCRSRKRELQQLAIEQQQFSDRLSTLNVALQRIGERLANLEKPEANVEKCRAAKRDCQQLHKELDRLLPAKNALQRAGETLVGDSKINDQLRQIDKTWEGVTKALRVREDKLRDAEMYAEKFWQKQTQHQAQIDSLDDELRAIKPTHESVKELDSFERKHRAAVSAMEKIQQDAKTLGSVADNQEALRAMRDTTNHLDRIGRNLQQKKNDIETSSRENEQKRRKISEAVSWMQSADVRLKAQGTPNVPEECKEKLRVINDIRSQAPRYSAHLPPEQWRKFEVKLADETRATENKLLELGHFEQALDEISEWTSRCSASLSGIGQDPANLQTDFARVELLQSELSSRRNALDKLNETATDKFPLKQKRLAAISDNLNKIGSIAQTKHDMMRNKMKQLETSNNKKKQVNTTGLRAENSYFKLQQYYFYCLPLYTVYICRSTANMLVFLKMSLVD